MRWYWSNKERQLERQKERRDENVLFIRSLKDVPCADCGDEFHFAAMDFDHLPQYDKKPNLSQLRTYSRKQILEEVKKCEVVCSNCHRGRTNNRL